MGHIFPVMFTSSTLEIFRSKQITLVIFLFFNVTNFEWYFAFFFFFNATFYSVRHLEIKKRMKMLTMDKFLCLHKPSWQNVPQFANQFSSRNLEKYHVFWSHILCYYWVLTFILTQTYAVEFFYHCIMQ